MIFKTDLEQSVEILQLKNEISRLRERNEQLENELKYRDAMFYSGIQIMTDYDGINMTPEEIVTVNNSIADNEWLLEKINKSVQSNMNQAL